MQKTLTPPHASPPQSIPVSLMESLEPAAGRVRITRAMCRLLAENGLLNGRYELINGEIISKMGQNPPHKVAVVLIAEWLRVLFGGLFVMTQSSIDVDVVDPEINEPEPDVIVLNQPVTAFVTRSASPADLALLVEVSDSTLRFDLRNKAALYARAGIAEYWVADIAGRRFLVHRKPTPNGYEEVTEYGADALISPQARPDAFARVADLLPSAKP